MSYLKRHGTRRVPPWAPLPGAGQVPNTAGGFAWGVDDWSRLRRFLILGAEGGSSYYAAEWTLTRENAQAVERCIREDGGRAVAEIAQVSEEGRAPKNDPALFALAMAAGTVSAGNPTLEVPAEHRALFEWIVRGTRTDGLPRLVEGFTRAQAADTPKEAAGLVREYRLPREALKSEHLTSAVVWLALLEDMPMTALIRNLAMMTSVGVIAPDSDGTATVVARLGDGGRIRKARVHPITLLAALRTYVAGRGVRGRGTWAPVREVVDALDAAFYTAFENVQPTGKQLLLALDVSGSMTWGQVAGVPGLTPRDASAALALVTAATEARYEIVGFSAGKGGLESGRSRVAGRPDGLTPLSISPRQRLDDAVKAVSDLPFGGTDCALPMLYAQSLGKEIDTFLIYTDSETWAGAVHPAQALHDYRRASGIDARLVVVGMVSNGFSIADPVDPGMLDVAGFDTATPQLIADFARHLL
jgi:60 kDa SS-A/Ro ribonucleoprotein